MYASVDDFVLRMGEREAIELTDLAMLGEVDKAMLTVALHDASSQIDGYLNGRYRLPLKVIPANLTRLCCDIARYHLTSKSSRTMTDEVEKRYIFCLKELESLAKGIVSLGVEALTDSGSTSGENVVQFFNGGNRIFERAKR